MKQGVNDIVLFIGSNAVDKAYLGTDLVYDANPAPPYDAQVEYLEVSGTQWLNFPLTLTNTSEITIDGYIGQTNKDLFSLALNGSYRTTFQFNIETSSTYYRFFFTSAIKTNDNNIGVRHLWRCSGSLYRDGVLIGSQTVIEYEARDALSIFNGTHGFPNGGRVYSVKVENNNQTLLDAIPVRVGQVGYMYDKVSGQLFGNAGTGDFILGSDVSQVSE